VHDYLALSLRKASQCALKITRFDTRDDSLIWSRNLNILKTRSREALKNWRDGGYPITGACLKTN
jgi:hypothetical protein